MIIEEVKNLQKGDEVHWEDPDKGLCSRYIIIQDIEISEDNKIVKIWGKDGDYLECFPCELS